ncbi:MAG: hypothetical protein ACP5VE_15375 [Chthonomonadales bacterium]
MPRRIAGWYTVNGVTYPSQYAYRKALAQSRGLSVAAYRREISAQRRFERLGMRGRLAYDRAIEALGLMRREGLTATQAARRTGTTTGSIQKYASDAVYTIGRRIVAKPEDGLLRRMMVPTGSGVVTTYVRGSREASLVSQYWNGVRKYIETGDFSDIAALSGKRVTVHGRKVALPTDRASVDRLVRAGEMDIDDIYPGVAA